MKTTTRKQELRNAVVSFFLEHAGFSYDPKTETPEHGRQRCAEMLADAEANASAIGYSFEWGKDGMTSAEWTDDEPTTETWLCMMRDNGGNIVEVLCGIDFVSGEPWGNPYRRVVEAELALNI